jgi:hypothetical protein
LAEKQKKAEYAKQYRLKRKLLIQQQASTSSEIELVRKQKMAEYNKLRHINNSVLSSLKMEGICFFFSLSTGRRYKDSIHKKPKSNLGRGLTR